MASGRLARANAWEELVMRRIAVAAAVIVVASLGFSACGDDDDNPKLEEQTLRFTEQETEDFGFADSPPKTKLGEQGPEKLSPSDEITFRADFVDAAKKDIGDLDVVCTITKGGRFDTSSQQCIGTATVPGGTLTLSAGGRIFGEDSTNGAVIGGTGKYEGATGNFESTETSRGQSRDVIHVFLPKK